jgi:iron complex outermembrane receptor protein
MPVRAAAPADSFDLGKIDVVRVTGERGSSWFAPLAPTVSLDDLRRFDRENIAEAVSLLPGVNVQNTGQRNERTIFVRGFNSRQVPLFIDGIPVYVPYDGNIDLARLTTADVAEVSVSKGFTSVLFGANTLGGSINVVTRRPSEQYQLDAGGTVGFDRSGDQNTGNVYLNAGTNQGLWYAQLGTSLFEQDYFRLPGDFTSTPVEDSGRRDNSASRDVKVSFKVGFTPNATDEYALSYQNQQGEKDSPPYAGRAAGVNARFWRWPEYDKESLYFIARKGLGDQHYARVRLYYDTFNNTLRSFDDASYTTQDRPFAFNSVYDDYTWGSSVELGTTAWAQHDLRVAFNYKVDVHRETDDDGAPQERYEDEWFSVGIEDRYTEGAWTVLAGLSYDQLQGQQADDIARGPGAQFDLASEAAGNAQAGVLYDFSESLSGRFSVSRRTRFPTIKDRYSFRLGAALPNPGLTPESAVNMELGLDGRSELAAGNVRLSWSAALFRSELDDAIETVTLQPTACSRPPCFQLQNIGAQTNQGVETALTAAVGERWTWHINYTLLDKTNDSAPALQPLDVPRHSGLSYVRFMPVAAWELLATVEYGSKRFSNTTGDRVAAGFLLAGAKAIWRPGSHLQLEAGIRNLTDELYAFEEGFFEPGRSFYATLRWQY